MRSAFMHRFLGIFAGLIAIVSFMTVSQAMPKGQPLAPAQFELAQLESYETILPSVLPAPTGLRDSVWADHARVQWYAVNGATVYELRIGPAGNGATTRFDRVLTIRDAAVVLHPGRYVADVRAGLNARDVHGHWATPRYFNVPSPVPVCSRECRALAWAETKIGDPYVYGAAGPSSFDCSGLVMWSFAKVGIYLPHNAAMQYGYGSWVSRSNLRPGDLVFFYSGPGHVGIYVGNGRMVAAPHTGSFVRIQAIDWSGYDGAKRVT